MNIKELKSLTVITLMLMLISLVLSVTGVEYEEMAWEHYNDYIDAEVGEDEAYYNLYEQDYETSQTILMIAGLLIYVVIALLAILTYAILRLKEIK